MSRMNKNLVKQATDKLASLAAHGQSKHDDKQNNGNKPMMEKIYAYRTMHDYKAVACRFARWMKAEHPAEKKLDGAKQYVKEYLQGRIDAGKSAWTVHQDAAALAKLYQVEMAAFGVKLPPRTRGDVKQYADTSKSKWQPNNHKDLVDLCKATGLRRSEMAVLKPTDVFIKNEKCFVRVEQGKGGKERYIEALNMRPYEIAQAAAAAGQQKIIARFPSNATIHNLRREFSKSLYAKLARPLDQLTKKEKYICRKDMRGVVFDRAAMLCVSERLGHERLDVVTAYLKER